MAEVIGVAEAKRRFAELIDRVQHGERFVVARRGRPVLALVPPAYADRGDENSEFTGFAALAGIMSDWPEFGEVMDEVYASRQDQRDRDMPYFDDLDP